MLNFENYIFNTMIEDNTRSGCFVRKVGNDTFEMVEFREHGEVDFAEIKHSIIDFNNYTIEDMNKVLGYTDYSITDLKEEFGENYKQAVCECLFDRYNKSIFTGIKNEAYKILKDNYNIKLK